MIVSYGGHGGGKAATQLKEVLNGCRMRPLERMPALTFPSRDVTALASKGERVEIGGKGGIWAGEREGIRVAFAELVALLDYI